MEMTADGHTLTSADWYQGNGLPEGIQDSVWVP